jgi:hypothetical protein
LRPAQANSKYPISKITRAKWTKVMPIDCLLLKHKALSSNPSAAATAHTHTHIHTHTNNNNNSHIMPDPSASFTPVFLGPTRDQGSDTGPLRLSRPAELNPNFF